MECEQVVKRLRQMAGTKSRARQRELGICPVDTEHLGISIPDLRKLAGQIKSQAANAHEVALALWEQPIQEAKLVASMAADPDRMTIKRMNQWVKEFDNWALCDQVCDLFGKTKAAWTRPQAWTPKKAEFVRRTGFVMMCELAVHDKAAEDEQFLAFFPLITQYATDERNFVKKAVNWSIRQIGKRSLWLNQEAIVLAETVRDIDCQAARWIAADALRELKSEKVQRRLRR